MTPYYDEAGITIYHADCRDVLDHVAYGAVVTDPPYGVNAEARPHGVSSGVRAEWDDRVPYELRPTFDGRPTLWFGAATKIAEAYRCFDRTPDRMLVWAPRFTLAMVASGGIAYRFHPIYAWDLPTVTPAIHDVFTDMTETGNWWDHQATKPLGLMRRLVHIVTDAAPICDPFMGSGTTLRAAKDLNRPAIGIEQDERYCEIAAQRLAQEVLPLW